MTDGQNDGRMRLGEMRTKETTDHLEECQTKKDDKSNCTVNTTSRMVGILFRRRLLSCRDCHGKGNNRIEGGSEVQEEVNSEPATF